jgi:hypothetical protein
MARYKPSRNIVSGVQTVSSFTPTASGAGWTTASTNNPTLLVGKKNHSIETTVLIDMTGIASIAATDKVLGHGTTADASITKLTAAVNGYVISMEVFCIETPATDSGTIQEDIDFYLHTAALASAASATGTQAVESDADWEAGAAGEGELPTAGNAIGTKDYYLHLVTGAGSGGTGTYTAGKFAVLFYGWNF